MNISNPHIIRPSEIKVNECLKLISADVSSQQSINVGCYYDDTEIKRRLDLLDGEVDELQRDDADFNRRLSILESNAPNYVTKPEFNNLEGRVTRLENIPVGLDDETMDEILNE